MLDPSDAYATSGGGLLGGRTTYGCLYPRIRQEEDPENLSKRTVINQRIIIYPKFLFQLRSDTFIQYHSYCL